MVVMVWVYSLFIRNSEVNVGRFVAVWQDPADWAIVRD